MNKGIIIQARTCSNRLPNKIIIPFYEGKCILEILLNRIIESNILPKSNIIVATTTNNQDYCIARIANQLGVSVFRGSEIDVLERFIQAAQKYQLDKIIRICADNLFLDMDSLRYLYNNLDESDYDYFSFITSGGIPSIRTHLGFFMEGVTLKALCQVKNISFEQIYHEHVTNYIYEHLEKFNCKFVSVNDMIPDIENYINLRLTIDTQEDMLIQYEIYNYLAANNLIISPQNILKYLENRPDIYNIMRKLIIENSK